MQWTINMPRRAFQQAATAPDVQNLPATRASGHLWWYRPLNPHFLPPQPLESGWSGLPLRFSPRGLSTSLLGGEALGEGPP